MCSARAAGNADPASVRIFSLTGATGRGAGSSWLRVLRRGCAGWSWAEGLGRGRGRSLAGGSAGDIKTREVESASTCARLELAGHEGLSDRLAEVQAELEDLQREVSSEDRRATAVEHLHAVLAGKRDQAQRSYIGPFREKVNAYVRILYGPAVDVAIDHKSLEISSRTLDGTTVPFRQLSGGPQEQLAVLTRLACAALVSPADADGHSGGVPVMIDDALGYSDPGRLQRLGAAITVAGHDCQVIVLTCEPGRYRGVGDAKVVPLT